MENKKFGALTSAVDPEKLAASVTGFLITSASLIVIIAGHLGFPVTVEQISTYAGALGSAIGVIWMTFGVLRKIVVAIQQKYFVPTA